MKPIKLAQNWIFISSLAVLCAACASLGAHRHEPEQVQAPSREIAILNHGYAMLYNKAKELSDIHNILRIKVHTKAVGDVMDALGQYGDKLQKQLQSLTKRYPALSIGHTGLPVVEAKKRKAVSHFYLRQMLPLAGRTGKDFNRTILQTQRETLNQARFYARVLIEEERDDNRKKLLKGVKQHLDQLHKRVFDLLKKNYYRS